MCRKFSCYSIKNRSVLVSRSTALSLSLKYYFTGKECKHGHVAPRTVSTRRCSDCLREENAKRDKKITRASARAYRVKYPHKVAAKNAKRRAKLKNATPVWLSDKELTEIEYVYKEARELSDLTGIEFQVDHVIPLNGELVSGLHTLGNLDIIPAYKNLNKSNTYEIH